MTAFRVMVNGRRVMMRSEKNEHVPCGFIKNEYVWAACEAEAIDKAKRRILRDLNKNPAVHFLNDTPLSLDTEEVERTVELWKLLSREGFIFYPLEPESQ